MYPAWSGIIMTKHQKIPMYVAGIIERHDQHVLIALPEHSENDNRLWEFPRGPVHRNESPEAAMRRITKEKLGLEIEIVTGQPPLLEAIDGVRVELRYFFCGMTSGDPSLLAYADIRWVHRLHLCEYEFDAASLPVTRWLLEGNP